MYIHPNFQKQSLGTFLLNSVFSRFTSVNKITLRVFEKNTKARNFYLKQGFREVSVRNANFITEITPSILMERIVKLKLSNK
ncbi:MAG: GNAT family N-acetyltransferase [Calothrix sp. SM1_7_51]|nr:GNAT family N-acetyltransferase [Calothrix sp. SM1_7_51]